MTLAYITIDIHKRFIITIIIIIITTTNHYKPVVFT